jgi:hypothetical protein
MVVPRPADVKAGVVDGGVASSIGRAGGRNGARK